MAALPYMPLYVADYLADAAHLSTLGHGAYLLLIMNYWQRGQPLPACDKKLARIARVSPDQWEEIRDDIAEFFREGEGVWTHNRIDKELDAVRAKSEQARAAGQASAQRKSNARSTPAQRPSNHTDTDTDTDNTPPLSPPGGKRRGSRLKEDWIVEGDFLKTASDMGFDEDQSKHIGEKFRDYWIAKAGSSGVKLDWLATWRNWLRNETPKASARGDPPSFDAMTETRKRTLANQCVGGRWGNEATRTIRNNLVSEGWLFADGPRYRPGPKLTEVA